MEQVLANGDLPKWVWEATDTSGNIQVMTEKPVPGCIDPTYCETNPPVPSIDGVPVNSSSSASVLYTKPKRGSMRFEDGEVVTYQCSNPSKYLDGSLQCIFVYMFNVLESINVT